MHECYSISYLKILVLLELPVSKYWLDQRLAQESGSQDQMTRILTTAVELVGGVRNKIVVTWTVATLAVLPAVEVVAAAMAKPQKMCWGPIKNLYLQRQQEGPSGLRWQRR